VFNPEQWSWFMAYGKEMKALFAKIFTGRTLSSFFNCFVTSTIWAPVTPFFLTW
jgi:hypothetical protein